MPVASCQLPVASADFALSHVIPSAARNPLPGALLMAWDSSIRFAPFGMTLTFELRSLATGNSVTSPPSIVTPSPPVAGNLFAGTGVAEERVG